MPKTYGGIWGGVVDYENLYRAYCMARRCKRYHDDVLRFWARLEEHLIDIQNRLIWKTWAPSRMREFMVFRPKPRLIVAPTFSDRVVHHALCNQLTPIFERKFIRHSYACRVGKGNHRAVATLRSMLHEADHRHAYIIQADISKYFASIQHDILLGIIRKTIRDKHILWLLERIIKCNGYERVGLPVGALTSQLCANIYLDVFDHYIKDGMGIHYYVRYMDDFIMVVPSKQSAREIYNACAHFLSSRLKLTLNSKSRYYPVTKPIDFCGYRLLDIGRTILPRKRNVYNARRRIVKMIQSRRYELQQIVASYQSYRGYVQHCTYGIKYACRMCQEMVEMLITKHEEDKQRSQENVAK